MKTTMNERDNETNRDFLRQSGIELSDLPDDAVAIAEKVFGGFQNFTQRFEANDQAAVRLTKALFLAFSLDAAAEFQSAVDDCKKALERLSEQPLWIVSSELHTAAMGLLESLETWSDSDSLLGIVSAMNLETTRHYERYAGTTRSEAVHDAKLQGYASAIRAALGMGAQSPRDKRTELEDTTV